MPHASAKPAEVELVQGLGLLDATMIVMGSMIGSGIFIVSADISRQVGSPGGLILVWLLTTFLTIAGALSYGELAAMMPQAGGMYVYLREAYGSLWGFLYGWALFLVIETATIAAVAIAFAKYFGVFLPAISTVNVLAHFGTLPFLDKALDLNTQNLTAILSIAVLTALNCRGIETGALVQNLFTLAKTAAVMCLVAFGLVLGRNPDAITANFEGFWRNLDWSLATCTRLAVAMVGSLFAAVAWENVTFTAGETRNPSRNLPLSLALGTGAVMTLYVATNFTYLVSLPLAGSPEASTVAGRGIQFATEDRVAAAAGEMMFGPLGAYLLAAAIMVSTFGCNNGLILAGARVYFAMARDGLFFSRLGRLNPRTHSPNAALILQGIWASFLTLTGTYSELLDFLIFTVLLFYVLTVAAVFVLRRRQPEATRPYRAFGYPVVPALYVVLSLFVATCILIYKPRYTWPGLIIVSMGVPVYFLWRLVSRTASQPRHAEA
jgi:APA family basic amino acid/polyamine antiporter